MGYCVEIFAVATALLADMLLGNYGCTPFLTVFVLFHSSQCISERFAIVAALVAGAAVDLSYCRASAWTPVLFVSALAAGRAVMASRNGERSRSAASSLLSGAVMGAVLALGEMIPASRGENSGWFDALCRLCSGIFWGTLEAPAVLTILDALRRYLGLPGFFGPGSDTRRHRVRAVKMGKRSR